ncbi:MAG: DUF6468 domain-containing protein [Alphaproteobacteria bacterium]
MLSLLLDVLVLIGLGVTIYYCMRLSKSLNNFRQYRQEFNSLLQELSRNIDKAQKAISQLKDSSFEAGEDLQKVINNSRNLADELQLMNDMGNALANRLERLSEQGRQRGDNKSGDDEDNPSFSKRSVGKRGATSSPAGRRPSAAARPEKTPSFFIQDREFEQGGASVAVDEYLMDDSEDDEEDSAFQSQAEKELFEALRKNNKGKAL